MQPKLLRDYPFMQDDDSHFRRRLSTLDLTLIGFGSIFGSGWLFSAAHVASMAGPSSLVSWFIGGITVLLLGLVLAELGASLPLTGGIIRYPDYTHGPVCGFLMGLISVVSLSSLSSIEVVAARSYANAWIPGLTQPSGGNPTLLGWIVQAIVLGLLYSLNKRGIGTFAFINAIMTWIKFIVPVLVILFLFMHFQPYNITSHGFFSGGVSGMEMAISTGGIIFAYLGLTPILGVAREVKNPQRAIPIAIIASALLSTTIYILLQSSFIGSIPANFLSTGWTDIERKFSLPFHDIALLLGLGWLASLVVADAVISPTGAGNIYLNSSARMIYAWSKTGTFFKIFSHVNKKSGIPEPALNLTFALALFWTLPFPSWQALVGVVSSASIISYAIAPVVAGSLRRTDPHMHRPFQIPFFNVLTPVAFIVSSLIVFWAGWQVNCWLLSMMIIFAFVFIGYRFLTDQAPSPQRLQNVMSLIRPAGWILSWCLGLFVFSLLGQLGGIGLISHPLDDVLIAVFSLLIYIWGIQSGLNKNTG